MLTKEDALKAMYIIPRTPTPPTIEERNPDTLTPAETRRMQEELRALKVFDTIDRFVADADWMSQERLETKPKVKREMSDDNRRPRKIARSARDSAVVEIDDAGQLRELRILRLQGREVIEID